MFLASAVITHTSNLIPYPTIFYFFFMKGSVMTRFSFYLFFIHLFIILFDSSR